MALREPESDTADDDPRPKTLDDVINCTSIIQKPLMVLLVRGLPSASLILGMTFLAPKIQNFSCVSGSSDTNLNASDTHDPRCYTSDFKTCTEWRYDTDIFEHTIKSEFNVVCEREWIINLSDSLVMVGMMFGNFIFSHISDWYGRRTADIGSMVLSSAGSVAMAASPDLTVFVMLRFLMAIGLGGGQIGTFTHAMESVNPKMRAAVLFCDSIGWIIGVLLLPFAPWFYRANWRHLQLIFSVMNIPSLILVLMKDESPRWLLATGRKTRARPVIKRLSKKNGMPHSDADVEKIIDSTRIIEKKKSRANIGDLFRNRSTTLMTLSFFIQFPITIFVYYDMMFFVVNEGDDPWMNFLYAGLSEIPPICLVTLLVRFCRRKLLYVLLYVTCGVSALAILCTGGDQTTLRVIFGSITKTAANLLFTVLGVHVNESYITRERGIALGFGRTVSRLGAIIAPGLKFLDSTFHACINAGVCGLAILAAVPLKETFDKPLADNDEDDLPSTRSSISCPRSDRPYEENPAVGEVEADTHKPMLE